MQQKINWTHILIFGISIISLFSCKKKVDYIIKLKYIYVNETDYNISFDNGSYSEKINTILSKDSIIINEISDGEKNADHQGIGMYLSPSIVYYNNILCDTLEVNIGPRYFQNYTIKTIKNNDFEYRYVFTKAFAERADTCR